LIGGLDKIFPVWSGATALDFCLRLISQWWPACVFVVDDDPTIYISYCQLAFRENSEVIVYRDRAACDAWDEMGYDDSLRGTMVFLISEAKRLTLVTEHNPSPLIVSLTEAISNGLPTAFPLWTGSSPGAPSEAA
jgi:hypothetical protein